MKSLIFLFLIAFCTSAFAQSKVATTPTMELYGYYQKGENVEEAVFMAEEYEALMARQGFTFLRTDTVSKSDYKLHWTKKYDGSVMQARIHYQFLIPYFKITIEDIRVTFSNGEVLNITSHLQNEMVRKQFNSLYKMLVQTLVRLIDPAKTVTKEQFREALNNLDKLPKIKND
ncbi:hypothetical protein [Pedobacter sp.]